MRIDDIRMQDYLQPVENGRFKLDHYSIKEQPTPEQMKRFNMPPKGDYTRLKIDGAVYMSDTPMERETNRHFVSVAFGDVLIGGLGHGMIVMCIQDKPDVKSVTVVELHQELIDMVGSQLPLNNKIKIVQGDIFKFEPEHRFDIIYLDIWPKATKRVYENEMVPLVKRYKQYLKSPKKNKRRKVFCWREEDAKKALNIPPIFDEIRDQIISEEHKQYLMETGQHEDYLKANSR